MYDVHAPRVISKDSLLTASQAELELLLPHVVLVKDAAVPSMFKPRCVHHSHIITALILNLTSNIQTCTYRAGS